jgi:hypothetical protein
MTFCQAGILAFSQQSVAIFESRTKENENDVKKFLLLTAPPN